MSRQSMSKQNSCDKTKAKWVFLTMMANLFGLFSWHIEHTTNRKCILEGQCAVKLTDVQNFKSYLICNIKHFCEPEWALLKICIGGDSKICIGSDSKIYIGCN